MVVMSRWLVGSSSAMMSQSCRSSRARSARRRCPPESSLIFESSDMPDKSVVTISRDWLLDAHSWSSLFSSAASRMVALSSRLSRCPRMPMVSPPRRVTRPESGVMMPARSLRSVDLPSPLRPTMPIRSPSATPWVTSVKIVFVA